MAIHFDFDPRTPDRLACSSVHRRSSEERFSDAGKRAEEHRNWQAAALPMRAPAGAMSAERPAGSALAPAIHDAVGLRLARVDQRYTHLRQLLVETLAVAGRPLSIPELLASAPELPQSSAYRNMTALIEVGVVRRVTGADDHGRFELAEELSRHHHHLVCWSCGKVEDVHASPKLERALGAAAREMAAEHGYAVSEHRLEMLGRCSQCQNS